MNESQPFCIHLFARHQCHLILLNFQTNCCINMHVTKCDHHQILLSLPLQLGLFACWGNWNWNSDLSICSKFELVNLVICMQSDKPPHDPPPTSIERISMRWHVQWYILRTKDHGLSSAMLATHKEDNCWWGLHSTWLQHQNMSYKC